MGAICYSFAFVFIFVERFLSCAYITRHECFLCAGKVKCACGWWWGWGGGRPGWVCVRDKPLIIADIYLSVYLANLNVFLFPFSHFSLVQTLSLSHGISELCAALDMEERKWDLSPASMRGK